MVSCSFVLLVQSICHFSLAQFLAFDPKGAPLFALVRKHPLPELGAALNGSCKMFLRASAEFR